MERLLVDSDILIDYLRKDFDKYEVIVKIDSNKADGHTTSISLFELYNSAFLVGKKEKFEDIAILTSKLKIIPFSEKDAYMASKIYSDLRKKGQMMDMRDIFVAACTIANNLKLVTYNYKHFERINELKLYKKRQNLGNRTILK